MNYPFNRWVFLALTVLFLTGCAATESHLTEYEVYPCPPDDVNCQDYQQEPFQESYLAPMAYSGPRAQARSALLWVIKNMDRTEIINTDKAYVHARFFTPDFKDQYDVKFLFPQELSQVEIQPLTKMNYYTYTIYQDELGQIRELFQDKMGQQLNQEITPPKNE